MHRCEVCGHDNRHTARFCRYCAAPFPSVEHTGGAITTPLNHSTPESYETQELPEHPGEPVTARPTPEDEHWLTATLMQDMSSSAVSHPTARRTTPLAMPQSDNQEECMEQSQPAVPQLFGGRYELLTEDEHGNVEVRDQEPWRCCWSCRSTENQASDSFCTNCGAALDKRVYRGMLSSVEAPDALALITTIEDEFARSMLPILWDYIESEGRMLVLLEPSRHTPVERPLDELTTLRLGAYMARLLTVLHEQGLMLGKISPEHVAMTTDGEPRLLATPRLQRIAQDQTDQQPEAVRNDLQSLAMLLETLSSTPRTTQRLPQEADPQQSDDAAVEGAAFVAVLRQVRTGEIADAQQLFETLDMLILERTRPIPLRQIVGACSDTGIVRDHNEDSLLTLNLSLNNTSQDYTRGLYIVADGMGGHAGGEVASGKAISSASEILMRDYLSHILAPDAPFDAQHAQDALRRAVLYANEAVRSAGQSLGNDMGTTITMVLVVGDRAMIANVGDSRTYIYRDGKLRRISKDHSLVMRLVELGQIAEEDIYIHPQRNAVLRSLGDQPDIEVDCFEERLAPGDALLLCSDGQWEMTHDPEMEQILERFADVDAQHACQELISAANQAGGEDNVTSILVRFEAV